MVTEFPGLADDAEGIATGSDGNLWFAEATGNKVGRITTAGAITEFAVPTAASNPARIAAGADGALWFTEYGADKIGRVTTAGAITEFAVPTAASQPADIIAGADGALWFTEPGADKLGRITTAGAITEVSLASGAGPLGIASGPDGNIWFTESGAIGRLHLDVDVGPERAGYCSVAGNTWRWSGLPIPPGTFLDLVFNQPFADDHYTGAVPANYIEGKGLTCDSPPAGYRQQGLYDGPDGDPGIHPYYAP